MCQDFDKIIKGSHPENNSKSNKIKLKPPFAKEGKDKRPDGYNYIDYKFFMVAHT